MKTVKFNKFMGNIAIPQNMTLVKSGVTKKGDRVTQDADFRYKRFVRVAVGGLPVTRYMAVLRRIKRKK